MSDQQQPLRINDRLAALSERQVMRLDRNVTTWTLDLLDALGECIACLHSCHTVTCLMREAGTECSCGIGQVINKAQAVFHAD